MIEATPILKIMQELKHSALKILTMLREIPQSSTLCMCAQIYEQVSARLSPFIAQVPATFPPLQAENKWVVL
jgi:hypothetical protein